MAGVAVWHYITIVGEDTDDLAPSLNELAAEKAEAIWPIVGKEIVKGKQITTGCPALHVEDKNGVPMVKGIIEAVNANLSRNFFSKF